MTNCEIMAQNRNSRWRPSAILDFQKPDFWPIGRLYLLIFHHCTKFGAKSLIDIQIMANKTKFEMAAVRYLGIVASPYKTTHEVFSLGHISLSNFMLIQCIVLKIWGFELFCRFGLKYLFTPPKFRFLGVCTPKRDWSSSRPPKGTSSSKSAEQFSRCWGRNSPFPIA